jgi:hypothetical protein
MANIDTTEYTAQQNKNLRRDTSPSYRPLQKSLKLAQYGTITLTSAAANDDIRLGNLGVAGIIHPAHCRLVGLSGSIEGVFTLEKVTPAGTVSALTGGATLATDGVEVPFLRASGALKSFNADDNLQLTITTATEVAADDTLELVLAYSSDDIL